MNQSSETPQKPPSSATENSFSLMSIIRIDQESIAHPFGDHRSVKQAFPQSISAEEADPFLMCDYFGMNDTEGKAKHPDDFPIGWHPHRGFDIASYLRSGTGRHADSLGNRETYTTPGMQWMNCGSGVMHAEGGANEVGTFVQGFQIWINVSKEFKMEDPQYGTIPTEDLPLVNVSDGVAAHVLAGEAFDTKGPFQTKQAVQMIDFELDKNSTLTMEIAKNFDTAMVYVYEGDLLTANGKDSTIQEGNIILFDANSNDSRGIKLETAQNQAKVFLFVGQKLKEPIAWHGPIVMNTQEEIYKTFTELQSGQFPPKKVDWDYQTLSSFPEKKRKEIEAALQ